MENWIHLSETNGLLLQTFQQTRTCTALRILPDNKILAGYIYTDTTGVKKTCLIRYRKNGKVDSSFGVNGILINNNQFPKNFGVGPYINIALLPDSSIIEFAINSNNSILYRYSYNGKPYASFGNNGSVKIPNSSTLALALDSDNNILIDRFINSSHYVARYKRSGKIDSSFGTNGLLKTPIDCDNILVQPDGKLVISGLAGFDAAVVRYRFNDESTKRQNNSAVTQKNITALFYPNPVKNILHIRGLDANTNYQIKIIDAAGNIVSTKEIKGNCDYNVSQLMRGVYYLNIFGNNNTASITKFVKE